MGIVIRTVTIAWQKVLRVSLLTAYYFLRPYSLVSDVVFNTLRAPHLSVQSPSVTSSAVPARGHLPYAPGQSFSSVLLPVLFGLLGYVWW